MLTEAENDLLTRVEGDAPLGRIFREPVRAGGDWREGFKP